ncbi:CRISPR-associated protein Csy3 [Sporomusaceae bacterium FL31]|nr:CRISPR-associated protein Csy3 [Sporomusaceae bacterium FL31]GCE32622.1 CRISPR-associated protein Csy3 [Sporomusaceae bacterium]
MAKDNSNIASVLAFEKKLVLSDGYLYGSTWEKRFNEINPLVLTEKSIRGTISNRLKPAILNDPVKLNAEVEKPNLQKIDACALTAEQDTLKLNFTIKVLGGVENPSACNHAVFNKSYYETAKKYIEAEGFKELAWRYTVNIANGRYLWRNRVGAEKIEVVVSVDGKQWTFDALSFSLKDFESDNEDLRELAHLIADALCGKLPYLLITVDAYALIGKAQEVYPSEELVLDKGNNDKNKKSKILYAVNGTAAMHSQKIGNAIRTIDTWYPEFESADIGPIAIEPYGAVTNLGRAYRTPKDKTDFYTLFDHYALGGNLANKEQEHYVMAVLVRGGVFGQSSRE